MVVLFKKIPHCSVRMWYAVKRDSPPDKLIHAECPLWAHYQICKITGCACAGKAGNVVHVGIANLWWRGKVPGIPGACVTRKFTYLARDPWERVLIFFACMMYLLAIIIVCYWNLSYMNIVQLQSNYSITPNRHELFNWCDVITPWFKIPYDTTVVHGILHSFF